MTTEQLHQQCDHGQQELMRTNYVQAERILADAEAIAWEMRDYEALSRLYMPLQETRRQKRQRCGEGIVCLDLVAENSNDHLDGRRVAENYPFGQVLVAGWGTIRPAIELRQVAAEAELYVETFLGAVYPTDRGRAVLIAPFKDSPLPPAGSYLYEQLRAQLPPHCLILPQEKLPRGDQKGSAETFALVMDTWEQLHRPFLADADAEPDPIRKMEKYRRTIEVDYACELAHQKLSIVAKSMLRVR